MEVVVLQNISQRLTNQQELLVNHVNPSIYPGEISIPFKKEGCDPGCQNWKM